jgi:RNA polymerase sigma factor (sigma-70 family)
MFDSDKKLRTTSVAKRFSNASANRDKLTQPSVAPFFQSSIDMLRIVFSIRSDNRVMANANARDERDEASDEALMQRFAAGEARAFETLYDRHEKPVWRFVLRSVREPAIADDVTQELWFAVARSATTYQASAKFRTWLFTMARNRVIDLSRTAKHHVSIDEEREDGEAMFSELAADSRLGPLRQLESRDTARQLIEAVEALPEDQREAFLLQAEGDMSVEEIAAATHVSFETAKSRLRYARAKLKTLLSPNTAPNESNVMMTEVRA